MRIHGWILAALIASIGRSQKPETVVLFDGREPLTAERRFDVPTASKPRLLIVRGVRATEAKCDAGLFLDGVALGAVSGFTEGAGRFAAALPLLGPARGASRPAAESRALRIMPTADADGRVILERIELIDAARVLCTLRDQATKEMIKGVVRATAVDGSTAPLIGPFGTAPREGAAWISDDGGAEIWVPLGTTATVVARGSPFRAAVRKRNRFDLGDGLVLGFVLPPDQRPEGARILEASDADLPFGSARAKKDAALDVGARVDASWERITSAQVFARPDAFADRVWAEPEAKRVISDENSARLIGDLLKPLVTVRLADGSLIHSNGPLPLLEDVRRDGERVAAWIKLRCPEDARLEAVYVRAGSIEQRLPADGPTTLKLNIFAPPGTPILLMVKGSGFDSAPPLERPFAVRSFRAP